jgi:hypothetical protein
MEIAAQQEALPELQSQKNALADAVDISRSRRITANPSDPMRIYRYRYPIPISAAPGKHRSLSIRLRLEPGGWRWELTEANHGFKSDTKIALKDAISEAANNLNAFLTGKDEPEHFISLDPDF